MKFDIFNLTKFILSIKDNLMENEVSTIVFLGY